MPRRQRRICWRVDVRWGEVAAFSCKLLAGTAARQSNLDSRENAKVTSTPPCSEFICLIWHMAAPRRTSAELNCICSDDVCVLGPRRGGVRALTVRAQCESLLPEAGNRGYKLCASNLGGYRRSLLADQLLVRRLVAVQQKLSVLVRDGR